LKVTCDELIKRHRLSSRQADDFLGNKRRAPDRISQMKKLQQLGDFLKLMEEMRNEGLNGLLIKGPALSQKIYGDPFYRTSHDFDLLFDPGELSRAIHFFECRGFRGVKFSWPESDKNQERAKSLMNQYFIFHQKKNLSIELHWKLFDRRFTDPSIAEKMVWENTATVEINGHSLQSLDGDFELLYLVIHGSLHAWFRLKWLVDVHEILKRRAIDEERFKALTDQLGAGRFVSVCNGVLRNVYPEEALLPCNITPKPRIVNEAIYQLNRPGNDPFDTLKNTVRQVRYQLALSPKWQYKWVIFRTLLFNKSDLEIAWLPAGRLSLFFFRPVTFVMRKVGWIK
jgi:hypothetical protein